ncbi:MAG: polysaccharide biosynthesis protein [Ruminococcus sp.]|nr:polysaccharide biosynthesis protein [Ruminococcus sp.]
MKKKLAEFSVRKVLLALADAFIVVFSALASNYIISFFDEPLSSKSMLVPIITGTICCFVFLFALGAYSKMWRYAKKHDYLCCIGGTTLGILAACGFHYLSTGDYLKLNFVICHCIMAICGICLFRMLFRTAFIGIQPKAKKDENCPRTMIVGGGRACRMILDEINNSLERPYEADNPALNYKPVCIIDDDKAKIGTSINGVKIVGNTSEIIKFAKEMDIELILLAIPSSIGDERQRIVDLCTEAKSKLNVKVRILPFIGNLIFDDGMTLLKQIHDIKTEALLGRPPIEFDTTEIRNFINGKVCMVTGGGGSIGSELVRQISKYTPKTVIIVDIYENNAYDIQQELRMEYGSELNLIVQIASVRDYNRMNQIYFKYKPQVVFHAAAHKHVPLMESSPMEAIKNNIIGTFNTASLAQFHNVEKFVMISTDKAVNPTNVMGASKRCCEMIVQYLSQDKNSRTEFVTTRFGNVLGSNGSVIPLFKRQIEQGKPVTVTDREIIRYFMTIPEAVSLVMQAAAIAKGGEIFILDMGKPVKIVTLAENLIRLYGKIPYAEVPIEFIGLRPGEKIEEELLTKEEGLRKTKNELIFIGKQIEIDEDTFPERLRTLRDAAEENDNAIAVKALHDMVPTFTTPEEFNSKVTKKNNEKIHLA